MKKGDVVKINYIGRLESGEIFDLTSEEAAKKEGVYSERVKYGPIPVLVGAGFVIRGLENAISEMGVGEKKSFSIEPKDGFGERDARLVKVVPQKVFKDQKVEPKQGMIVDFSGMKGRIQSVSGGRIRIDFNNPLAGKMLKYELEIVEKIEDSVEKMKGIFEFFGFRGVDISLSEQEANVHVTIPNELKQKISNVILDNIHEIKKINFVESFEKKETNKQ
ncbi:peptidylprolyl isomerase [archaeon]|nr:peptidylprolyl isomerase [archaeon]